MQRPKRYITEIRRRSKEELRGASRLLTFAKEGFTWGCSTGTDAMDAIVYPKIAPLV